MKKFSFCAGFIALFLCLFLGSDLKADAADTARAFFAGNPNVTLAPDGKAFTFGLGDTNTEKREARYKNYVVNINGVVGLPDAKVGMHEYEGVRRGKVPVAYWKLEFWSASCIHSGILYNLSWHGLSQMGATIVNCRGKYPPGWKPYCAICGELIEDALFYMSDSVAATIGYLPSGTEYNTYFYLCPFDRSVETEFNILHTCKCLSPNMYKVCYVGGNGAAGSMGTDEFYYDNAREYEGDIVIPQTRLSQNLYKKDGYLFRGWSLKEGGAAVISNGEAWKSVQEKVGAASMKNEEVIYLYAVWDRVDSSLELSFKGAYIGNNKDSLTVSKEYGYKYTLPEPKYSTVKISFNGNGGNVEGKNTDYSIDAAAEFSEWKVPTNLRGKTDGKVYVFSSEISGSKDRLTAICRIRPIILPSAQRSGYNFTGWYDAGGVYAGGPGEEYVPSSACTLTAGWEKVTLVLNAKCDYKSSVNGGRGAVDLDWEATGGAYDSAYRIYMSEDGSRWSILGENGVESVSNIISRSFNYTGAEQCYQVTETGVYKVVLSGAEGGSYGINPGGKGGRITLRLWLIQGETLSISCGGTGQGGYLLSLIYLGGYGGGGIGYGGSGGGGATSLYITDKKGAKHLVAVSGGGGGASVFSAGGAGGSSSRVFPSGYSSDGAFFNSYISGCTAYTLFSSGGGGGFNPGYPGTITYTRHVHTQGDPSCRYHVHSGNSKDGGGCYSVKEITKESIDCEIVCYASGTASYVCGNPGCGQNATLYDYKEYGYFNGMWHYTGSFGYPVCPRCGDNHGVPLTDGRTSGSVTVTRENTVYKLGCGLDEGFNCTNNNLNDTLDNYSSSASGGGANYVDRTRREYSVIDVRAEGADCIGVNSGNGSAALESVITGCRFDNELSDIAAPDKAAPGNIPGYTMKSTEGKTVTVSWDAAKDMGTKYYFKADNYSVSSGNVAVVSNIVSRNLMTGIAGYYVREDSSGTTSVNAGNAKLTTALKWDVTVDSSKTKYLHVAAVDKAGNIGPTTHIAIDPKNSKIDPCWDILTKKLQILQGDNVHGAGGSSYYVRADGKEPFYLKLEAYMNGPARDSYQIDKCYFKDKGGYSNYISVGLANSVPISDGKVANSDLSYGSGGLMPISRYSYTDGTRKDSCSAVNLTQGFVAGADKDGLSLTVIPGAEATEKKGVGNVYSSDSTKDAANGIKLIFDGKGPVITGLESIDPKKLFIDVSEETKSMSIRAFDKGAGLDADNSYLRILNKDSACEMKIKFSEGTDGTIRLDFTRDRLEELFCFGSFEIQVYAVDLVGNITEESIRGVGFDMDTDVVRLLESLDGKKIFARGESGDLYITTTGFVEKVEVFFPDELSEYNAVFDYTDDPEVEKKEVIRFMIPLYDIPEGDWDFTIKVVAHKGEEELESHPRVSVVSVSGSVLDELRTGLE